MYSNDKDPQLTIRAARSESADAPVPAAKPVTVSITGYRQLGAVEQALINEIKEHAEQTRFLVNRVMQHAETEVAKPLPEGQAPHSTVTHPSRWAALAQTDLQMGFMKLVRAVAQPTSF
jgi:hypothetical protein